MRSAIMQPYFLPYLGYWQLINAVDVFVIYDDVQYSKRGWFSRNNLLLNGKKTLFSIPLEKSSDYLDVKDKFISKSSKKNITKILNSIKQSYRNAPHFDSVYPLVESIFEFEDDNLFNYIYNSVNKICEYIGINTQVVISSELGLDKSLKGVQRVIDINKKIDSSLYINPIGGVHLYDRAEFERHGIELKFLQSKLPSYEQNIEHFEPYLSIIDVMMWCSKVEVKLFLNEYELI